MLPVSDDNNYVSLAPNGSATINIQANLTDLQGDDALVVLDGWNTTVTPTSADGVSIAPNLEAQPSSWPATACPFKPLDSNRLHVPEFRGKTASRVNCG